MFCPQCGTTNQDAVRYCTRCGANLAMVSDAISGKFDLPPQTDERIVKLLKDFYRGRLMSIVGFVLSILMTFKLALSSFMGITEDYLPLTAMLAFFLLLGLIALIWGTVKWANSSSELTARGCDELKRPLLKRQPARASLPASPEAIRVQRYTTGSITEPTSVTEQTTRQLENRLPLPALEKQSKPTS